MSYSPNFETIVHEIDRLIAGFDHERKDIGYGYRWTLHNGQRIDLIDYKKKGRHILRVGRGARLVRQHPILHDLFDEVSKVIAKYKVYSIHTLHDKHLTGLLQLLDQAPKGIGAFD